MRISRLVARINPALSSPRPVAGMLIGSSSNSPSFAQRSRSFSSSLPRNRPAHQPAREHSGAATTSVHDLKFRHRRHMRSLLVPACRHFDQCPRVVRAISTDTDPKRGTTLKYSEDSDSDRGSPHEYKLRVGTAIRTLREELPQFFQHGLCTTSIYASNIRLIEASHTNVSLQGKPVYFLLAGAVRWSFKMWFRDIEFEIQSIRVQDRGGRGLGGMDSGGDSGDSGVASANSSASLLAVSEADRAVGSRKSILDFSSNRNGTTPSGSFVRLEDSVPSSSEGSNGNPNQSSLPATTLTVRWTLKGTTRPSVVLTTSGPTSPPPSSYEGVFVYQFNDYGMIDEHRIENIMPSPSPEAIQRAFAWWGWLLSRTRPTAAAATGEEGIRKRLGLGCISNR